MTHSEARKPSPHQVLPLRIEDFMKEPQQPARTPLPAMQSEAAKFISMRATLDQAMPGVADSLSGDELLLMGAISDAERQFRARLKPGTKQDKDWSKFARVLRGRSEYIREMFVRDTNTDLEMLQANGMVIETAEILEKKRNDPLYASVRSHLNSFISLALRTLEDGQRAEIGMTSLDLRSVDEFLSKHSLVEFFSSITNVNADKNDPNVINPRDLMAEFLLTFLRNSNLLSRKTLPTGLEQDRRAEKQAIRGVATVDTLRKMAGEAILDPEHSEHATLANKFLKEATRAKSHKGLETHLGQIIYGGGDMVATYRNAFAHLKNGDEPELYEAILDLASIVNNEDRRYVFMAEVMDLQTGEKKDKEGLKSIQDIATSVSRILPGSSKTVYSVDVGKVEDWGGLRKPDSVQVDLDKRFPTAVRVEFAYGEGDEAKQLEVLVDTKKKDVRWSILEPASAYPDFADQLVHVTAEMLEALEQTVQRPERREVVLFQNSSTKKPAQRSVHEHHRPHAEAAPRKIAFSEVPLAVESNRRAGSVYMSYDPEELMEMCKHLSAVDQQRIKPMLDRLNEEGVGFFKVLRGRIAGNRIGELRSGDIRVLGLEEEAADDKQQFKVKKVLYKGAVKDREWKQL